MKILLVTTGGTIASVISDNVIDVTNQGKLLVLDKYKEIDPDTEFTVISPVNILSENVSVNDYKAIAECLCDIDFDKYDGVIITHGSDTLAYTSALVGLLFDDVNKPIMLVAADRPLEDESSNGMDNFVCAVALIRSKENGVFVPYRNSDGVTYIHYATNLLESSTLSDDFYSVCGAYAVYENEVISKCRCKITKPQGIAIKDADLSFDKKIMQINPYPSIDYSRYDISDVDAVLHRTYHAGTMCAVGDDDSSVISLLKRCKAQGVPFYICGVKGNKAGYSSLDSVIKAGANVLYDMSPACAYIKLMIEG